MKRQKRHIVYFFLALIDVALLIGCYVAVSSSYVGTLNALGRLSTFAIPLWHNAGILSLVIYCCALVVGYALSKVYGAVYLGRISYMAKRVFIVNTVGIGLFAAGLYALHMDDVSRLTLLIFYLVSTIVIIFKHWLTIQFFYRSRLNSDAYTPVLVVGCGALARRYAEVIGTDSSRLEHVVGYVVPNGEFAREEDIAEMCPLLRKRLGIIGDLDQILSETTVSEIVIALETVDYPYIQLVINAADKHGTALSLVPFYNDIIPRQPDIESVQGVKIVNLRSMPLDNMFNAFLKRAADIVISTLIIVLLSWFMAIVAICVKLTSPGPVFFKQERTGRNGKPFMMLKFRSMRVADDPVSTFTEDKEERKTKFGRFIRKFSIDELPQFLNVFVGDMSVIGPRPVVDEETFVYSKQIPLYMLRHQVRPGISGWAQINGYRGDSSVEQAEKRTELDLWYIEHWSPWLDIKIFIRTIFGGFVNGEKL